MSRVAVDPRDSAAGRRHKPSRWAGSSRITIAWR